jgi:hypothetical protein
MRERERLLRERERERQRGVWGIGDGWGRRKKGFKRRGYRVGF